MFFMIDNIDIASYADDNNPYSAGKGQCDIEAKLQKASVKLFKCLNGSIKMARKLIYIIIKKEIYISTYKTF